MTDPTPNPLVVDVEFIAKQLKLDTPLDEATSETIQQAILEAQADVEAYLQRHIVPIVKTQTGVYPPHVSIVGWPGDRDPQLVGGWRLDDDDVLQIITATPEVYVDSGQPTGAFTITYLCGIDVRNDVQYSPIKRWITAAARNDPAVLDIWMSTVRPRGALTNITVDGQSASFAAPWHGLGTIPGSGAPGALPTLASLFAFKRAPVFQRRDSPWQWPFDDRVAYGPWGP